jgi:malate dehydrogenase
MRPKITVLGSGELARATAQRLSEPATFEIFVYDRSAGAADREVLGIEASGAIRGQGAVVEGGSNPAGARESDIVILAADDSEPLDALAGDLAEIVSLSGSPLVVVSEDLAGRFFPMALSVNGVSSERVIGTGTLPASARLQVLFAHRLGISAQGVEALAIGRRGIGALPLIRFATASGIPVLDLIPAEEVNGLIGAFNQTQAARSDPGDVHAQVAAVERIISAVALGQPDLLPCTVLLEGQYGVSGVPLSVPIRLGPAGVEQIVELDLTMDELIPLRHLASASDGVASHG